MTTDLKRQISAWTESQVFFTIFKLPVYIITAVLGFIFEFIYELPFRESLEKKKVLKNSY